MNDSPPPTPKHAVNLNVSRMVNTGLSLTPSSLVKQDRLDDDTSVAVESLLRISNTSPQWIPPSPISTLSGNSSPTTCTDDRREPTARDICSVTLRGKESNSSTSPNIREEVVLAVSNDVVRKHYVIIIM